jgi:hypothetical protein
VAEECDCVRKVLASIPFRLVLLENLPLGVITDHTAIDEAAEI